MKGHGTGRGRYTLALYPNARGMAWIAFEGPATPYDWGFTLPKRDKSRRCLAALDRLMRRLDPETLILEDWRRPGTTPSARIGNLHKALVAFAAGRGLAVVVYTRGDLQACFAQVGARTRQEIAEAVGRHFEILAPLVPPARRRWDAEHWRMPLFNAAALAVRHYWDIRLPSPPALTGEMGG